MMDAEIRKHRRGVERLYVNFARYTLEVDFKTYAGALRREMERGAAGR